MLRLERGGAEFLHAVTGRLFDLGATAVYSPALYAGSSRVWRRSGFDDFAVLDVMERPLSGSPTAGGSEGVFGAESPRWDEILDIDRLAFEGFWGMSRTGIEEAHATNRSSALLETNRGDRLAGYAIVGAQWGTVYLHRIAVHPEETGRGLGAALLAAAIDWGNRSGGRTMILNVRPENQRAKHLYVRAGFGETRTSLQVLRHRRD
jgi:ribosomal protein S18 acetylase RimI-like enzyme